MSNPEPLEIEKKFLIDYPDISVLETQPRYTRTEITQVYINEAVNGAFGRIRKRGANGNYQYTKTFKRDITAATRIEIEEEISAAEYEELLSNAREGFSPISKERITFLYDDKVFEIDLYAFWNDKAIMEIELKSEDESFSIPSFIHIIKDVTEDKRFRNSAIAKNGQPI